MKKSWEVSEFLLFSGSLWGYFRHSQKLQKPLQVHIARRQILSLCGLNSMGNTLKVEYKFGAWQIL